MTDGHDPEGRDTTLPDAPLENGVPEGDAETQDDEHMVPEGADEDVRLADSWVKDRGEVEEAQAEQREAGGFR